MAILLWDGQFLSLCAFSREKWALEGPLQVLVVDVNKIRPGGDIDSEGMENGNEILGINVVVEQGFEDYANVVSDQDNSGWCDAGLAWKVVECEEVGSEVHKGSIQDMVMNDRSGLYPMMVHVYGCMHNHVAVCSLKKPSYYSMAPCGSHQSLFGFPDHERDSRNLSPVWTHPCLFTNSPNSFLKIRCFYNTKSSLTLVDLIGFCLGRDCGSYVSAVCPAIEWVTMRITAICPKMNFLSRSKTHEIQFVLSPSVSMGFLREYTVPQLSTTLAVVQPHPIKSYIVIVDCRVQTS